jgi:hypothetical protein
MRKLPLHSLSDRHLGLTRAIAETYIEAASVCFSRHHIPPVELAVEDMNSSSTCDVEWSVPDLRTERAHANLIDATEAGAYAVCLAAVELERGLVAVGRAETRTGADYYVAGPDHTGHDLEDCIRLEISAVDKGASATLKQRLREKLQQARNGDSNRPAVAAVVGFARTIALASLEDS